MPMMAMFRRLERASPIGLRHVAPSLALRPYVSSFSLFHADLAEIEEPMRADLPQLRFVLAGQGDVSLAGRPPEPLLPISLVGPTMAAARFRAKGPVLIFSAALLPAGWAALVREDAMLYRDRQIDATHIFPTARDVLDAMMKLPMVSAMTEALDRLLIGSLTGPRARADLSSRFTEITDKWLLGAPSPEVGDLLGQLELSARQVERLAGRLYGAPPKLLARKYRALRSASLLRHDPVQWQANAAEAFYDQSHMIREVRHFTGLTPRRLQIDPPIMMRLSLERRNLDILPPLAALT